MTSHRTSLEALEAHFQAQASLDLSLAQDLGLAQPDFAHSLGSDVPRSSPLYPVGPIVVLL
ncbi:unnamed protein product, partial [Ilex paraguariensis]